MIGCSNRFAENECHSVEKIIESEDRYAKETSTDGYLTKTVSMTTGENRLNRDGLWTKESSYK